MRRMNCIVCGKSISVYQRETLYCIGCYKISMGWGEETAKRLLDKQNPFSKDEVEKMAASHNPPYHINIPAERAKVLRTIRHMGCNLDFNNGFRIWNSVSWITTMNVERTKAHKYKKDKCEACGMTNNLGTHHRIPLAWGGNTTEENIATLCHPCHLAEERKIRNVLNGDFRQEIMLQHLSEIKERLFSV